MLHKHYTRLERLGGDKLTKGYLTLGTGANVIRLCVFVKDEEKEKNLLLESLSCLV